MSQGKSFAPLEKNAEDRVSALERQVSSYQERINGHNTILDAFKTLTVSVQKVREDISSQKDSLDTMGSSVADLYNQWIQRANQLQSDLQNVSNKVEINHQSNAQDSNGIKASVKYMEKGLSDLREITVKELNEKSDRSELIDLKGVISNVVAEFNNQIRQHIEFTNDNLTSFKRMIQEVDANGVNLNSYTDDHANIMEKISDVKKALITHSDQFASTFSQITTNLSNSISNLRGELTSKPSEIMDFKNEMAKKLELASLDGSNANARSLNADQKILVLEKKIESLSLLLKKLELSK